MLRNLRHTRLRRRWCNEANEGQRPFAKPLLETCIGPYWEIGDEYGVKAGIGRTRQRIAPCREQRIQVREQDDRYAESGARNEFEYAIEGHARGEGFLRARLNDRTVRHRIGERNADFEHVRSCAFQTAQQLDRRFRGWMTGGHIGYERASSRRTQLREFLRDAIR